MGRQHSLKLDECFTRPTFGFPSQLENASGGSQGSAYDWSKWRAAGEAGDGQDRSIDALLENSPSTSTGDAGNSQGDAQFSGDGLACPFQKRNRQKFNRLCYPQCNRTHTKISTLKTHIRKHHQFQPAKQGEVRPENPEDGIYPSIEGQLTSRKDLDKVDSWESLWMALFPDDDSTQIPDQYYDPSAPAEYDEVEKLHDQISTETLARFETKMADMEWGTPEHNLGKTLDFLREAQSESKNKHLPAFKQRLLAGLPRNKSAGDPNAANPGEGKVRVTGNSSASKQRVPSAINNRKRRASRAPAQSRPRKFHHLAPKVGSIGEVQSTPLAFPIPHQDQTRPGGQAEAQTPFHTQHPDIAWPASQPHVAYATATPPVWQANPAPSPGETGVLFAVYGGNN
ncbi:hypothetical protein B0H67DRAFT_178100 [Lasiosphaeris hirsuta]|uniref:C2H2-type domain-containing protein n=1 Tax=Lasiosphaeris hirsuta TaxID=260670 RepID=A0AA40AQI8_9PEZI|nr:hypothetical protein B0H67DRAFT_178100 [Lasiosphaeris hirsuta]